MKKSFSIQVKNPCDQNFAAMPRSCNAMYCGSCQKNVIDFSAFSDADLVRFFSSPSNSNICGLFRNAQLEKEYEIQKEKQAYFFRPAYLLMLGLLSFKLPLIAQQKSQVAQHIKKPVQKKKPLAAPTPTSIIICGRVHDDNGNGIHAKVFLESSFDINTIADISGIYEIEIPVAKLRDTFALVFHSENFDDKTVRISRAQIPGALNVIMQSSPVVMYMSEPVRITGGAPILSEPPILCLNRWQRFKYRMRRLFS